MSAIFRSKLIESRSGYFSNSIGVGIKNPSGAIHIASGNLILESGTAEFYSRPNVSGIPVMISGDVQLPNLSIYETVENFNILSGFLYSDLSSATELIYQTNQMAIGISGTLRSDINASNSLISQATGNIANVSGTLQAKIDILNALSGNHTSIKSDYFSGASYVGRALVGSLDSDLAWTVTKIQISSSGTLSNQPKKALKAQWSNRYFLNYT